MWTSSPVSGYFTVYVLTAFNIYKEKYQSMSEYIDCWEPLMSGKDLEALLAYSLKPKQ